MKQYTIRKKKFISLAIYGFTSIALHTAWVTLAILFFSWKLALVVFLALYASNIDKLVTRTLKEYNQLKENDNDELVSEMLEEFKAYNAEKFKKENELDTLNTILRGKKNKTSNGENNS